MSTTVMLIDESYLKKMSPVNLNVDTKIINSAIYDTQQIDLYQELGSPLYNKMINLFIEGNGIIPTGTTNYVYYSELYEYYIKPYMIKLVLSELYFYDSIKITNNGVKKQNAENSESVDNQELINQANRISNKAKFLAQKMKKYLIQNEQYFPEYLNIQKTDDLAPTSSSYFCGVELDEYYTNYDYTGKNFSNGKCHC